MDRPMPLIFWIWMAWILSWLAAAAWTSRTSARPPARAELPYRLVTLAGALLMFEPRAFDPWRVALWPCPPALAQCMIVLAIVGVAVSWWARLHLGRMWSGSVTRKSEHRIVDTGPYRWVRHPIYTGIITAAVATTILTGTLASLAGLLFITGGFWLKARLEERFLMSELGPAAYAAYARGRWMLFPLPWRSGDR